MINARLWGSSGMESIVVRVSACQVHRVHNRQLLVPSIRW
jgi:hypothetical protein